MEKELLIFLFCIKNNPHQNFLDFSYNPPEKMQHIINTPLKKRRTQ